MSHSNRLAPWIQLKYFSYKPAIYPAMISDVSPGARPGDWIHVYDRDGNYFGTGLYNPKAKVPLRVVRHGNQPASEDYFVEAINAAIDFRTTMLGLPTRTDCFRVVHSDGDGLSGLVVDKYADVLSISVHSLGIYNRLSNWLPLFHERLGTKQVVVDVGHNIARLENIRLDPSLSSSVKAVRFRENNIRFEVDFDSGHKTGFFCDQRDNRMRFAELVKGMRVLDLCCYTGGFALASKVAGGAEEVTGVDLDEKAIEQAKRNANLNQTRINWVHCDAFSYARQMQQNGEQWDAVVLDPPKLILSRDDEEEQGYRKYVDLNQLAISLVKPGGLFATCSCSGLLSELDFEKAVIKGAHRQARKLQFFDRTGAGPDHPVMSNCLESRYLKVFWARVL